MLKKKSAESKSAFSKINILEKALICCLSLYLPLIFSSCASARTGTINSGASLPDWIRDPYIKFDRQVNVAARGSGNSLQAAEKNALGNLVAIFGQSIQVDEKVSVSYQEAVKNGVVAGWSEDTSFDSNIATAAGMDYLVGAEIGDSWYDGRGEYYVIAVLNKTKAFLVYPNMIKSNQAMIDKLVDMPIAEKNTIEGFTRYQFAAAMADINISYGNLLSQIGAPMFAQGLKPGNDYRLEAVNITREIPVGITVKNDKSGRIQGAFAKALSDVGFRSGGDNARYVLAVDISVSPVDLPNQTNKFSRIEMTANFTDTSINAVLLPFNFNGREGHITQEEAENRAYAVAERKIINDYKNLLSNYLSQLLPARLE